MGCLFPPAAPNNEVVFHTPRHARVSWSWNLAFTIFFRTVLSYQAKDILHPTQGRFQSCTRGLLITSSLRTNQKRLATGNEWVTLGDNMMQSGGRCQAISLSRRANHRAQKGRTTWSKHTQLYWSVSPSSGILMLAGLTRKIERIVLYLSTPRLNHRYQAPSQTPSLVPIAPAHCVENLRLRQPAFRRRGLRSLANSNPKTDQNFIILQAS